jgi:hypothetical protein
MASVPIANEDFPTPMRIDTFRIEDSTRLLALLLFSTLGTVFIATFCVPQFSSEQRSVEFSDSPIQITSPVLQPANHFVFLSVAFTREGSQGRGSIPVYVNFSLSEMPIGGRRRSVLNYTVPTELVFGESVQTSAPFVLYSSHLVGHASYSGSLSVSGNVSEVKSVMFVWKIGHPGMTFYVRFLKVVFLIVVVCVAGFYWETRYCSGNPRWSNEGRLSGLLLMQFVLRIIFWNYRLSAAVSVMLALLVDSVFFVLLRFALVQFLKSVRQKMDVTLTDQVLEFAFLGIVLVIEFIVNGFVAFAHFDIDQLRREKVGFQLSFIVEVMFLLYLAVQFVATLRHLDEAEKPRYWIYVLCTTSLCVVTILGRAMEGLVLNFALLMIPEVAVVTVQFAYVVIMVYLHWPAAHGQRQDYADTIGSDLGALKGGESLVE